MPFIDASKSFGNEPSGSSFRNVTWAVALERTVLASIFIPSSVSTPTTSLLSPRRTDFTGCKILKIVVQLTTYRSHNKYKKGIFFYLQ